jgi:hypothetical protein
MDISESFWSLVLLIICFKGSKRIGLWEGSNFKKNIYRTILPIIAFLMTFVLSYYIGYEDALKNLLFYSIAITIILHLSLKRPAQIWVKSGILPFSSKYPKKEIKDWNDMINYERLLLIGILISSVSFEIPFSEVTSLQIFRSVLFLIGILSIALSIYLKYSEIRLFIGFIFIFINIFLYPFHKTISMILFWVGVCFFVWSYFRIKKKRLEKI